MHFQHLLLGACSARERLVLQFAKVSIHAAQDAPDRACQQNRRACNIGRDRPAGVAGRLKAKINAGCGGARRVQGDVDGPVERRLHFRAAFPASLNVGCVRRAVLGRQFHKTPGGLSCQGD